MAALILKMRLLKTSKLAGNPDGSIEYMLHAVHGAGNETWSQFTPSGEMRFTVTNPTAPELVLGAEYLVKLEPMATTGL